MEIKVGEETLEVRPTLRHKQKLLGLQQNAKKGMSEADWAEQHRIFKEILKTADETAVDEELDGFLMKHDIDFMMSLYVGFGWAKEEDLDRLKGELTQKVVEEN